MLNTKPSLYFPGLVSVDKVNTQGRPKGPTVGLYKLTWGIKEYHTGEEPVCSDSKHGIDYFRALPDQWDNIVKRASFAIPRNYLDEIRKNSKQAEMLWGTERGFDTMIREICLEPVIAHVGVAFKLLGDCLYDDSTGRYDRGLRSFIINEAMIYKFWFGQTGHGLLWRNAGMDHLVQMAESTFIPPDSPRKDYIRSFLDDIRDHEKEYLKYHGKKYGIPCDPVMAECQDDAEQYDETPTTD